jgi:putative selenate reductase
MAVHEPDRRPVSQRAGFELVEQTLSEGAAREEASRCLQCSTFCDKCVEVCPNRANYAYSAWLMELRLPVLACQKGSLVVIGQEDFALKQVRQIVHVNDLCNECGNCATFCVHQGKPYAEKPRLFLQEQDFELETGNAFFVEGNSIRRREGGREMRLTKQDAGYLFEDANLSLDLSAAMQVQGMTLKRSFEGTCSLKGAVEMALVLHGITASLPFLPCARPQGRP